MTSLIVGPGQKIERGDVVYICPKDGKLYKAPAGVAALDPLRFNHSAERLVSDARHDLHSDH